MVVILENGWYTYQGSLIFSFLVPLVLNVILTEQINIYSCSPFWELCLPEGSGRQTNSIAKTVSDARSLICRLLGGVGGKIKWLYWLHPKLMQPLPPISVSVELDIWLNVPHLTGFGSVPSSLFIPSGPVKRILPLLFRGPLPTCYVPLTLTRCKCWLFYGFV